MSENTTTPDPLTTKIKAYLAEQAEPVTAQQIAEAVDLGRSTVTKRLAQLIKDSDNEVEKIKGSSILSPVLWAIRTPEPEAAPEAAPRTNGDGTPMMARNGLYAAVVALVTGDPSTEFAPSAVTKTLSERMGRRVSTGAVSNALERMVERDGTATRTSDKPRRYQAKAKA